MDRFLAATEELLRSRRFEEIGVQEIARRARRPIGSFYARFASKDALLPHLYARYDAGLEPLVEARFARLATRKLSFAATVGAVVDLVLRLYSERLHLLRTVSLFARSRPGELPADLLGRRRRVFERPAAILLRHRARIRHRDPEAAARLGVFFVAAVAREKLLFGDAPHARVTRLPRRALRDELVRMLHTYLTCEVRS